MVGRIGKKVFKRLTISKRQRFISASVVLTCGMFAVSFLPVDIRYQAIAIMTSLGGIWALWSTWEDLSGVKFLIIPILPIYYTASFSLFSFLLPTHPGIRFLIAAGFGLSFYVLLLTLNVFNVSAIRTIQLIRAAHAVGFLFTLLGAFAAFSVILSFRLPHYILAPSLALASFPLFLQALWTYELEDFLSQRVLFYAIVFSLVIGEVAWVFSFWPVISAMSALILIAAFYLILGITQAYFENRLSKQVIYEYLGVSFLVFLIVMVTTRWGG